MWNIMFTSLTLGSTLHSNRGRECTRTATSRRHGSCTGCGGQTQTQDHLDLQMISQHSMFTVNCILFTVYCITCCILYLIVVYYMLFTVYCILFTVYCILFTVYCILFTVYCILFTVYCILFTVYCILFTVHNKENLEVRKS